MERLPKDDIRSLVRGRPGLIIGQSLTVDIAESLASKLKLDSKESIQNLGTIATEGGTAETDFRSCIETLLRTAKPTPALGVLAKVNWSAVLSFAIDRNFEIAAQSYATNSSSRNDILTVSDFKSVVPPRVTPCFKLLGVAARQDFPVSKSQLLVNEQRWRFALRKFSALVLGNPVVVAGLSGQEDMFLKLLAQSVSEPNLNFGKLLFFDTESIATLPEVSEVLENTTKVFSTNATIGQLVESAVSAEKARYLTQTTIEFDDEEQNSLHDICAKHHSLFVDVLVQCENVCGRNDHHQIVEELFSPDTAKWSAFKYDYDFRRDVGEALSSQLLESDQATSAWTLVGGIGSGKTSILKRAAFDLAANGSLVLWAKPWNADGSREALRRFFSELAKQNRKSKRSIVIFVDDPFSFGMLKPAEIAYAAEKSGLRYKLVVGARRVDFALNGQSSLVGSLDVDGAFDVADDLTENEWDRLSAFLTRLKIAEGETDAIEKCKQAESRSSRDTLGTLYWLLPNVRKSLKGALAQQYFRLGDYSAIKSAIVGGYKTTAEMLRKAWGFAAVSEKYHATLPLEVLVNSLGVNFDSWLEASKDGNGLAGILYETDSEIDGTVCFRTRNWIVAEAIVEAINGGVFGTAGEFGVLRELVEGCRGGGTTVYHDFLVQILVPHTKIQHLGPNEGLALYDQAFECQGVDDKLMMHHRGLWIKNNLDDPVLAEKAFLTALEHANFPYSGGSSGESDRYIYTSLASNVVQKLDKKLLSFAEGKLEFFQHLSHARSLDNCDSKIAHLQCKLVARMARSDESELDNDLMTLMNRAISDVDRAVILHKSKRKQSGHDRHEINALIEVRDELQQEITNIEELRRLAEQVWASNQSQAGFVLCARSLHRKAIGSNRGGDFRKADDYCISCLGVVDESDFDISPELAEVTLHNLASWQMPGLGVSGNGIDWARVSDLCDLVAGNPELAKDPLNHFFRAVASCHLEDWSRAMAIFANLRGFGLPNSILNERRAILIGVDGVPRKVQGTIKKTLDNTFISVPELNFDFETSRQCRWRNTDEHDFAFIEFSFGRPIAITDSYAKTRWNI